MKKILGLSILLNMAFCLFLTLREFEALAVGGQASKASANGDINGDGLIDIADPIRLLEWLFLGGQGPVPFDCPEAFHQTSCLLATGVKTCYGDAGIIDCSLLKARGQDGYYQLGCPPENRFIDNGDGTVSDKCTGLMWTKTNVDVDGDGEIVFANDSRTWLGACQFAEDMEYLGYDDWRVPNIREFFSIFDYSTAYDSRVSFFTGFKFDRSWTSTPTNWRPLGVGEVHNTAFECDCSSIRYLNPVEPQLFVAVRGPTP